MPIIFLLASVYNNKMPKKILLASSYETTLKKHYITNTNYILEFPWSWLDSQDSIGVQKTLEASFKRCFPLLSLFSRFFSLLIGEKKKGSGRDSRNLQTSWFSREIGLQVFWKEKCCGSNNLWIIRKWALVEGQTSFI